MSVRASKTDSFLTTGWRPLNKNCFSSFGTCFSFFHLQIFFLRNYRNPCSPRAKGYMSVKWSSELIVHKKV